MSDGQEYESPALAGRIGLIAGPILAILVFWLLPSDGLPYPARACGGVATLMAVWWMTETLPLEATALLPLMLLPLTGVYSSKIAPGSVVAIKESGRTAIVESVTGKEVQVVQHSNGIERTNLTLDKLKAKYWAPAASN